MKHHESKLGGIIHTYLAYDPRHFPSPIAPAPDLVSPAFEHMLMFGSTRELTAEQLARAVHLDPSQIRGLGPSIDALIAMLLERRRRILATYEVTTVLDNASRQFQDLAGRIDPPPRLARQYQLAVQQQQIRDLEAVWYRAGDDRSTFARQLTQLIERLGEKYQIDELNSKYQFTGRQSVTIPEALAIKEELDTIERLLKQLEKARDTAQIGLIDVDDLSRFAEPGDINQLRGIGQQIEDYLREIAERQGLEFTREGYRLAPQAFRLFQSRLLQEIFNDLQAARSGRHSGPVVGDGAADLPRTRPYEFGDSIAQMDVTQSMINAMLRRRSGNDTTGLPGAQPQSVRLISDDIEIHETRNTPKCATVVILDMSGSMRYDGQYVNVKRMGLALDGLIRTEYPGDYLQFIEMYTFAKPRHISELPALMPKPVTISSAVVRLKADMSDPRISEFDIPPHFTNIQRSMQMARQLLSSQDTPNRQIILITDGLPTAHFEGEMLYLLYPANSRTEQATMREAAQCMREGITINVFLLPNWSQTREDVQFAQRMVQATGGRVFFSGGRELDRFVVWDYIKRRRSIIA